MISGLFIQSRRKRERGQGVVGSHIILWGKSLFFSSTLTKNIFKNYSLLLIQRFFLFFFYPCETLLQYVYSLRCTVHGVLHATAQASLGQGLFTTGNFLVPARLWMYNDKPHSVQQSLFVLQSLPLKTVMKVVPVNGITWQVVFPQTHCKRQ